MAYQMLKKGNRGPRKAKPRKATTVISKRRAAERFKFRNGMCADLYFWLRANHGEFCDELKARATAEVTGNPTATPEWGGADEICSRIETEVEQFLYDENPLAGECDPFANVVEAWLCDLDYGRIAMAIYLDVARTPAPEIPELV